MKIRSFIVKGSIGRSGEYKRLLCTALRAFFHFLFVNSLTQTDLYHSVPSVHKYLHATPPSFLSADEMEQVLMTADRSTATGQRDYAILLLLARLGLRAGEIALLELDDIRWRAGELIVRGKGQNSQSEQTLAHTGWRADSRVYSQQQPPLSAMDSGYLPSALTTKTGSIIKMSVRPHRSVRQNVVDNVRSTPYVPLRDITAFIEAMNEMIKPCLMARGHSAEEVDA